MTHTLPTLPYAPDALAPLMSQETIEFHHGKHLQTYIDNLNRLIEGTPYAALTLEEIVKQADGAIFNNAAQAWNHAFFFEQFAPRPMVIDAGSVLVPNEIASLVACNFGSTEAFVQKFAATALSLFGSGWVWLSMNTEGKLVITAESNAGTPLTQNLKPLLTLDVWEHAYYIDYRNQRAAFISAFWQLIDWDKVATRL